MLDRKAVMACGHVSNYLYTDQDGAKIPVCGTCLKIKPSLAKEVVSLKGRIARCRMCKTPAPSSPDLFSYEYHEKGDTFYDGCQGW